LPALHRVRERLASQPTGVINPIPAFLLAPGISARQGFHCLRTELPVILAKRSDALSPSTMRSPIKPAASWVFPFSRPRPGLVRCNDLASRLVPLRSNTSRSSWASTPAECQLQTPNEWRVASQSGQDCYPEITMSGQFDGLNVQMVEWLAAIGFLPSSFMNIR
jgi:hypothetical protein